MLVAAFFRLDGVPRDAGEVALDGVAVEVGELDAGQREDGHVAVGEEVDVARVVKNAGNVGGDEGLALAYADDDRRAEARGDNLVRLGGGENAQGKRAGEALDGAADGDFKRDGLAGGDRVVLHLFDEVGNDLGVGLGDELVALLGEFAFEVEIVFDNAVMNHDDAAGAVAMGMGVFFSGAAMGGPARVADAEGAVEWMFAQDFLKVAELAGRAAHLELGARGTADGDASRIVAAVFEAP